MFGRFDVVDIIESDDPKQVEKAAMIIRAYGHSTTEIFVATPSNALVRKCYCNFHRIGINTNMNISAVTFAVRDMPRSIKFYKKIGFEIVNGVLLQKRHSLINSNLHMS